MDSYKTSQAELIIAKALTDDPIKKDAIECYEQLILPMFKYAERFCTICRAENCVYNKTCIECGTPMLLHYKCHNEFFEKKKMSLVLLQEFKKDFDEFENCFFYLLNDQYYRIDPDIVMVDPKNKTQYIIKYGIL